MGARVVKALEFFTAKLGHTPDANVDVAILACLARSTHEMKWVTKIPDRKNGSNAVFWCGLGMRLDYN